MTRIATPQKPVYQTLHFWAQINGHVYSTAYSLVKQGLIPEATQILGVNRSAWIVPVGTPWPEVKRGRRPKHDQKPPPGYWNLYTWITIRKKPLSSALTFIRQGRVPNLLVRDGIVFVPEGQPWPTYLPRGPKRYTPHKVTSRADKMREKAEKMEQWLISAGWTVTRKAHGRVACSKDGEERAFISIHHAFRRLGGLLELDKAGAGAKKGTP